MPDANGNPTPIERLYAFLFRRVPWEAPAVPNIAQRPGKVRYRGGANTNVDQSDSRYAQLMNRNQLMDQAAPPVLNFKQPPGDPWSSGGNGNGSQASPTAGSSTTGGYFAGLPQTGEDQYGPIYNPSGRRSSPEEWLNWMQTQTPVFERNGVTYTGPGAGIRAIRQAKERGAKKGDSGMLELRKPLRYRGG